MKTPSLKIDKEFAKQGHKVDAHGKMERRVIANLLNHIVENKFKLLGIDDGEEFTSARTIKDCMELIFNLDECDIVVQSSDNKYRHSVSIVLGNSSPIDIICNWSFREDDADGFDKIMENFNAEDYA